mmetsp:Transcript_2054/g.4971  ORF Transcript_2054/g.4971 Transcript_2054/m.4971 type:complete len:211 (-) Transcript_2054:122-754(-)
MAEPRVKNVVHEMSIWKQLIEQELRSAREWEGTWGFLKAAEGDLGKPGHRDGTPRNPGLPRPGATPFPAVHAAGTSRNATPRNSTPRHAMSRNATPRNVTPRDAAPRMAATGMAVLQAHAVPRPTEDAVDDPQQGGHFESTIDAVDADLPPRLEGFTVRERVLARSSKTPRERYGKQVLTSHQHGWGKSLEKFGVNHYGLKRNPDLWAEV